MRMVIRSICFQDKYTTLLLLLKVSDFAVEAGDVVLVATDGVFDNVPRAMLVSLLAEAQGETRVSQLQTIANSIAFIARRLAFDQHFVSPFAKSARQNGIDTIGEFRSCVSNNYVHIIYMMQLIMKTVKLFEHCFAQVCWLGMQNAAL